MTPLITPRQQNILMGAYIRLHQRSYIASRVLNLDKDPTYCTISNSSAGPLSPALWFWPNLVTVPCPPPLWPGTIPWSFVLCAKLVGQVGHSRNRWPCPLSPCRMASPKILATLSPVPPLAEFELFEIVQYAHFQQQLGLCQHHHPTNAENDSSLSICTHPLVLAGGFFFTLNYNYIKL